MSRCGTKVGSNDEAGVFLSRRGRRSAPEAFAKPDSDPTVEILGRRQGYFSVGNYLEDTDNSILKGW